MYIYRTEHKGSIYIERREPLYTEQSLCFVLPFGVPLEALQHKAFDLSYVNSE